jgi:hypothetical protein
MAMDRDKDTHTPEPAAEAWVQKRLGHTQVVTTEAAACTIGSAAPGLKILSCRWCPSQNLDKEKGTDKSVGLDQILGLLLRGSNVFDIGGTQIRPVSFEDCPGLGGPLPGLHHHENTA